MTPLGDFFICTISIAFVRIAQLWPPSIKRCEAPFVIFCTGKQDTFYNKMWIKLSVIAKQGKESRKMQSWKNVR